ncbi:hypothetical protein [Bacteroides eggerthii]|uniref:hypothetical protein n=1 Tax=Bacteroides eggerthii TaxID=28111 RepID=UPI0015FB070B|nr:hypothetical protein [Bacteroides eggerthii]MBV4081824.1 hypothetical protein [Bacteroides eggerthii]
MNKTRAQTDKNSIIAQSQKCDKVIGYSGIYRSGVVHLSTMRLLPARLALVHFCAPSNN